MKHKPFQSIYRQEFEVVEQRQGNTRLYPHTDQLPVLLRALNLEFYGPLPGRIARVDQRADGFHKIVLHTAATMFCHGINAARSDSLRLYPLLNPDLVTKVAIVQQITESTARGGCHHFRFYTGNDFFPEIYLSGKRVVFADHVLERFSARVPNNVGADLSFFLLAFFGSPIVSMSVGPGRAFILSYMDSILALTYKETATEFFVTTCLTINEINSLGLEIPPCVYNFHYGAAFVKPKIRNWIPTQWMMHLYKCWQSKVPLPPPQDVGSKLAWPDLANWVRGHEKKAGHGPGSRYVFADHIPGPRAQKIRPNETEPQFDELAAYKQIHPEYDWDTIVAEQAGGGTRSKSNDKR